VISKTIAEEEDAIAAAPQPDPNAPLRVIVRQVLEMRDLDGPQRQHFKRQIAAYALVQGPVDEIPGLVLSPTHTGEILEMSAAAVCNARTRIRSRMESHVGFRMYVEDIGEKMMSGVRLIRRRSVSPQGTRNRVLEFRLWSARLYNPLG
jgi:hypothetical protein